MDMNLKALTLAATFIAALQVAPITSAGIFLTGRNYPSGEFPVAAAVQDFNNDGILDIVSANENDKNVSVFLGNPNGTFGVANTFSVGAGAIEVASADLNRDGKADLVVTDGIKSAYVALGNGDGTFGPSTKIALDTDPIGIAIGDLNGDGILDLAIAIFGPINSSHGQVAILLGTGDGTFASPVFYELNTQKGNRLVATDLNNDGKLDLAVALQHFSSAKNGLAVLLGNGDGTFQPAISSLQGDTTDVAAADFNGDGNTDLALTILFTGTVEVVLGNGDGTFQPPTVYSAGGSSGTVSAADLNGDSIPDLVIGGAHTPVLLGDGSGGFGPPIIYAIGEAFARVGDFNRDGAADIVARGSFSEICVGFGRGDGSFKAPLAFPVGIRVDDFDSGDFNGDGLIDIVVGRLESSNQLQLLLGTGDGGLVEGSACADFTAEFIKAADLNRDGNLDLVVETFDGFGFYTILGNGDGTFQPALFTAVRGLSFDLVPTVDDFNNDGLPDVALSNTSLDKLMIFLGVGDGTFQAPISSPTGNNPESLVTGDFNGDGNKDVIVSSFSDSTVGIYLGNGDGTFQPPLTISSSDALFSAPGDFNRDGKLDFVLAGDGLKVFLGNGDGTFQPAQQIDPELSDTEQVSVADIDGDGRLDIAASSDSQGIVVLRGKGDGTFRPAKAFPTGSDFSQEFVLADLNGDQLPEVVVGNAFDALTVLLNTAGRRR